MYNLPYNANVQPYDPAKRYSLMGRTCVTCAKPLDASSFVVTLPRQQIDGVWYTGSKAGCCSHACIQAYLEGWAFHPEPVSHEVNEISTQPITDTLPTQETRDVWVYAFSEKSTYPDHTERSGKWLVFLSSKNIDATWQRVKQAVEQGQLGSQAKASTIASPGARRKGHYVICVYTYDYEDSTDARRIRQVLRDLGITQKLPYKSNEDTLNRRYGSDTTSIYYE